MVSANCQGSMMKCWGVNLAMDWHPIQGGVVTPLVASCHGNSNKLQSYGLPGSSTDIFKTLPDFTCGIKLQQTGNCRSVMTLGTHYLTFLPCISVMPQPPDPAQLPPKPFNPTPQPIQPASEFDYQPQYQQEKIYNMTTFQVKFLRILLLMLQGQLFSLCLRNNVEKGKGYLLFTILQKLRLKGLTDEEASLIVGI